jgi:hypothetical protein
MPTNSIQAAQSTGANRQVVGPLDFNGVFALTETVAVAQFTDGGSTSGTYQMAGALPAGAIVLASKIGPVVGFAGDTTATLKIGDGSTADRYMTGTPSVFASNAVGIECGVVSGTKLLTAANRPTLTITSTADFTSVVTNGAGVVTVSIFYISNG